MFTKFFVNNNKTTNKKKKEKEKKCFSQIIRAKEKNE